MTPHAKRTALRANSVSAATRPHEQELQAASMAAARCAQCGQPEADTGTMLRCSRCKAAFYCTPGACGTNPSPRPHRFVCLTSSRRWSRRAAGVAADEEQESLAEEDRDPLGDAERTPNPALACILNTQPWLGAAVDVRRAPATALASAQSVL
jgi:hypothetical protein